MILLDKIYSNIFWVVNKRLNPQRTTIWALNYLFFPTLSGLVMVSLSLVLWLLSFNLDLKALILFGIVISFFLSEKLIDNYYTDDKQRIIIKNNPKPGLYRYFVFLLAIFLSLSFMIFFILLAGIILHKIK